MTAKQALEQILQGLPGDQEGEVLDFARFLSSRADREEWREFGQRQLARAYGSDEPEYSEQDLKPDRESAAG